MRAKSPGRFGFGSFTAGAASRRIEERTEMLESPLKGRRPVAISNRSTPNEKMSVRWSMLRPSACSGDMYAAVPTMDPSSVSGAVAVG
jgi:hypothetical protein